MALLAEQEPQSTNVAPNPKFLSFSTIMSSSQTRELTEVKHLARSNDGGGWGKRREEREEKIQAKEGNSEGWQGEKGKRNPPRRARGKLSLWQGRVMLLHSPNAVPGCLQ